MASSPTCPSPLSTAFTADKPVQFTLVTTAGDFTVRRGTGRFQLPNGDTAHHPSMDHTEGSIVVVEHKVGGIGKAPETVAVSLGYTCTDGTRLLKVRTDGAFAWVT